MRLEEKVSEGGGFAKTALDLDIAVASTVGAYNVAGEICSSHPDLSASSEQAITIAALAGGAILGYKARSICGRIARKLGRNSARNRIAREISANPEFLNRQGIERKKLGFIRNGLKYALSAPAGAALGYIPGKLGIIPLCVYFGVKYDWSEEAALDSGEYAGALIGAIAFAEMAAKKQWKRMTTTASALAGITAGYFVDEFAHLDMLNDKTELWTGLGVAAACGAVAGTIGNLVYKELDNKDSLLQ